ncbi:STY0301 family protein [Rhodomicrobium lacus]|uniref:STY0301 family protein n=1 Tax=Rhodomicrobium lacus TaxID=2498452 RepID=UPI00349F5F00
MGAHTQRLDGDTMKNDTKHKRLCVAISSFINILAFCIAAHADNQFLMCPKAMETTQSILKQVDGFDAVDMKTKNFLNQVQIYLDHPSKRMSLIYDEVIEMGNRKSRYVHHLDPKWILDKLWIFQYVSLLDKRASERS